MTIKQPEPSPLDALNLPEGAVTFCSSYTGDCLWFKRSKTPAEPGKAPRITMGDAGESFQRHDVMGHELWFFAQNLVAEVSRRGGPEAVQEMIDGAHDGFDPDVYEIIRRDTAERLAELARAGS
jgi:hypothetical protein